MGKKTLNPFMTGTWEVGSKSSSFMNALDSTLDYRLESQLEKPKKRKHRRRSIWLECRAKGGRL